MGLSNKGQDTGSLAEQLACQFLQKKGLGLLQKNYRCFHGEIDLIMRDQDIIVFVEVRSRSGSDFGNALESINYPKIKKVIKAATHYLQRKNWLDNIQSRFDVVAIQSNIGKIIQFEWIKNAFA